MKIIGVIGTRRRNTGEAGKKIFQVLDLLYEEGDWICSGGCEQGGDRFAEKFAKSKGTPILTFYPNYDKYKRGAPLVRNGDVAKNSNIIIACVMNPEDGIDKVLSREKGGTEDTLKKFVKLNTSNKEKIFLV